jgi:threonine dehydratase
MKRDRRPRGRAAFGSSTFDVRLEVELAEGRIRPHVVETALERSPIHDRPGGNRVWLKLENLQHTGSFKVRGALNKLLALPADLRARGVVAASTGNHGAALAYALRTVGAEGTIYVPDGAARSKLRKIEELGARVETVAGDPLEAELHARSFAAEHDLPYVSPYNDPLIIGGQGTVGVELARQLRRIDAVFVSLGGGGLICGLAGFLRFVHPDVRIVGCSPVNSPVMIRSIEAGKIVELQSLPTLSDGTAGGVERNSITLDLCRRFVDDFVTVTENEIRHALRNFVRARAMKIEGAAAVAIAAYQRLRDEVEGDVVIVLCGGNIDPALLASVVQLADY